MSSALIFASLTLSIVACAIAYSQREFRSTSPTKRLRQVEQQMSDLQSSFESLLESHKSLRSRVGMRELRARNANNDDQQQPATNGKGPPPPIGSPKAVLRAYYGLDKLTGGK